MPELAMALHSSTGYFYLRHAKVYDLLQEWGSPSIANCLDAFAGKQVEGADRVEPATTTLAKL